jgi:hypothetical protein
MSELTDRIDGLIARFEELDSRAAFGAIETVFGQLRQSDSVTREDIDHFFGLVTLVLLKHARGGTVRFSGAGHVHAKEAHLRFGDVYEAALDRTMAFLARNFFRHLDEYEPKAYRMAVLRAFAKEYDILLTIRNGAEPLDSIRERRVARDVDDATGPDGVADDEPACAEPEVSAAGPAGPPEVGAGDSSPDAVMLHDWYVGTLSRLELAQLYDLTLEQVNAVLLHQAGATEDGRLYPLVAGLIHLNDDGDIYLLSCKGLTAEQIAEKVGKSRWVVHKHLQSVRKRFEKLREMGEPGRKFAAWLFGARPELAHDQDVLGVLRGYGPYLGLVETHSAELAAT